MGKKVSDMLKLAILTETDYDKYHSHIPKQIISAKPSICKDVISHIKKVIKSKSFPPQQKLRALHILNACMETSNINFILSTQDKILTRLSILASYKKEVPVPVRAEGIFGSSFSSNPVFKESSIEFINSLLLYLKSWASNFGKCSDKSDSLFFTTFKKLKESGVVFPASEKKEEPAKGRKRLDAVVEVENILRLLVDCKDEELAQDYKEMARSHVKDLKSFLKKAVGEGQDDDADEILGLLDRIAAIDNISEVSFGSPIRRSSQQKVPEVDFEPFRSNSDFSHSQVSGTFSVPGNWSQRTSSNFEYDKMTISSDIPSMRESVMTAPIRMDSFKRASITDPDPQAFERLKKENLELLQTVEVSTQQLSEKNSQIWILEQKVADLIKENQRLTKEIQELKNIHQPGRINEFSLNSKTNKELAGETKGKNEDLFELDLSYKKKADIPEPKAGNQDLAFNFTFSEKSEKQEKIKENLVIPGVTKQEEIKVPSVSYNQEKKNEKFGKSNNFNNSSVTPNGNMPKSGDSTEKPQVKNMPPMHVHKKNDEKKTLNEFSSDGSSDEDSVPQIQIPFPDLPTVFRKSNCSDSGLLFENDSIQVGFQLKLNSPEIFFILLIGNKSSTPITEVTTELLNLSMDCFPIIMQPIKTTEVLNKQSHTSRMLKGQLISPTSCIPSMKITIKSDSVYTLSIKLPITIARFSLGQRENPSEVWADWKKMAFEEKSFASQLGMFSDTNEICRFLGFGNAFVVYSKAEIQELGVCEFLATGRIEGALVMFAVNANLNARDARVRVRCRNDKIVEALIPVITYQISNNFN